jgi:hypothetical protein
MNKPQPQVVPPLPDVESREGARSAILSIWDYLTRFFAADYRFKSEVFVELTPLYGEAAFTPGALLGNHETLATISVPGVIPGYFVEATYDQDLLGLQMTAYVSAPNVVSVSVLNGTAGSITAAAGKLRVWVWPRILTP